MDAMYLARQTLLGSRALRRCIHTHRRLLQGRSFRFAHVQQHTPTCPSRGYRSAPLTLAQSATQEWSNSSWKADYEKKQEGFNSQTAELRHSTEQRMRELVSSIQQQAAPGGSSEESQAALDLGNLPQRLAQALSVVQEGLVERDVEVRLLLLAALSGEHMLFIGPPGTAKSELSRRLSELVKGKFFERLLTRFTVPEELFGPLSMKALEDDKYIRQIEGYLPDANVAFLDEIFKANAAILNTILTILQERKFDNGSARIDIPLICLVGASNELPESEELDALYDRFLVRRQVKQVSPEGIAQLLQQAGEAGTSTNGTGGVGGAGIGALGDAAERILLTAEDFRETRQRALASVRVPQSVVNILVDLRGYLQDKCEPPVYVSDRRLVKAVALMQVAAYTNGRDEVSPYDCLLLQHILWNRPAESERIADWLLTELTKDDGLKQLTYLFSGCFGRACKAMGNREQLDELLVEVVRLREVLSSKLADIEGASAGGFPALARHLWLGTEEGAAVSSALLPKLRRSKTEVQDLLFEVVALEVALEGGAHTVVLADLVPSKWADYIRNAPKDEVRALGTRNLNPPLF